MLQKIMRRMEKNDEKKKPLERWQMKVFMKIYCMKFYLNLRIILNWVAFNF